MILYRIQATKGHEWTTEWCPTAATGKKAFDETVKGVGKTHEVCLEKVDVLVEDGQGQPAKSNVALALNHASLNRSDWKGETVKKHAPKHHDPVAELLA